MTKYTNESVSSIADLITKLDTWMAANGWTSDHLDVTTTAGTGGEWAMTRTGEECRFAASWDAANSGTILSLYHYAEQAYVIADRPWGQDHDSGNGFAGTTPDSSLDDERHVDLGTPSQYWAVEADHYTYVIVQTGASTYCHFGFGILDKRGGDWTGGSFVYGQKNSGTTGGSQAVRDDRSHLLDGLSNDTGDLGGVSNGMELYCATIYAKSLPNQPAGGMFGVCMGGKEGSPQTDFGTDRQSNDGASSDVDRVLFTWGYRSGPWANGFYRSTGTDRSGEQRLWPIGTTYVDTTTGDIYGTPIGYMPGVYGLNIQNWAPGDELTDSDGNVYWVFPAHQKYSGSGAETGTSGYLGIAYLKPEYEDPGLPSSVSSFVTGWYSSRNSADYTLSGSEVTQLNDKSGNGNHLTPGAGTGPTLTEIDGRQWLDFESSTPTKLEGSNTDIDPDGGDFSCVVVFRSSTATRQGLFFKEQSSNQYFGFYIAFSNSRSVRWAMRDTNFANNLALEHDDAGTDYTDGTSRIVGFTYDDSEADARLFGGNNDPSSAVAENLVYASGNITPASTFRLGEWADSSNEHLDGQIAEVIFFNAWLAGAQWSDVWDYLKEKWGIS